MSQGDLLARVERRAAMIGVVAAVIAWLVPAGGRGAAAAVLGGALISGVSYWAIKRGVTGLTDAMILGSSARYGTVRGLIMLVGRYALLALIAYVMISRLQLSPLGLLVGVSVIPAAVTIEALAALRNRA